MSHSRRIGSLTLAAILFLGCQTLVNAQTEAARAIYESSGTVSTNIEGIRTFPAPPANFNALTASDEALAGYGFPPRPDKATDPSGLAKWTKAMSTPTRRWNGQLKPRQFKNMPMKEAKAPAGLQLTPSVGHTASTGLSTGAASSTRTS